MAIIVQDGVAVETIEQPNKEVRLGTMEELQSQKTAIQAQKTELDAREAKIDEAIAALQA